MSNVVRVDEPQVTATSIVELTGIAL